MGFCVCLLQMCPHPYVHLTLYTHIYYITSLHAYGSEAADQHNDGDSRKTRRGFKPEEGTGIDRENLQDMKGGAAVVIVAFTELCV